MQDQRLEECRKLHSRSWATIKSLLFHLSRAFRPDFSYIYTFLNGATNVRKKLKPYVYLSATCIIVTRQIDRTQIEVWEYLI